MPSKGLFERAGQSKSRDAERSQNEPSYPQHPTSSGSGVPGPGPACQGSHLHTVGTSQPEQTHCRGDVHHNTSLQRDFQETSNSNQHIPTSRSQVSGVAQRPEQNFSQGAAIGRRNATCSYMLNEYLASHDLNEELNPRGRSVIGDANDDSTEAAQQSSSTIAERWTGRRSRPGAVVHTHTSHGLRSTEQIAADDDTEDDLGTIGAFWNDQAPRKRGRHG